MKHTKFVEILIGEVFLVTFGCYISSIHLFIMISYSCLVLWEKTVKENGSDS
jgi:hypothetical protein